MQHNFYTICSRNDDEEDTISATVLIDKNHPIFKGHFPEKPVLPGVCMIQIIKDLLEDRINKFVLLESIANLKFINIVNPFEHPEIEINLKINRTIEPFFKINGVIFFKDIVFLKIVNAIYT
jgi:3-hydroxyacyl-[acyl-carrier-protein] dehydratase